MGDHPAPKVNVGAPLGNESPNKPLYPVLRDGQQVLVCDTARQGGKRLNPSALAPTWFRGGNGGRVARRCAHAAALMRSANFSTSARLNR
jgi:hypothetical protein